MAPATIPPAFLATVSVGVPACILFVIQIALVGDRVAAAFLSVITLIIASTPAIIRRSGSLVLGGNVAGLAVFVGVVGLSVRQGGLFSPTMAWLVCGPFLLLVCELPRSAAAWIAADALAVAAMALSCAGQDGSRATTVPDWMVVTSHVVLFVVLMIFLSVVETARRRALAASNAANAELQTAATALAEQNAALLVARDAADVAARAKAAFLSTMSHELHTPLNGVLGAAEVMRGTELTAQQAELVRAVHDGAGRLERLVGDVLEYAQLGGGSPRPPNPVVVELRPMLTEVAGLARPASQVKGLDLRVDLADDLPQQTIVDPARLRCVLRALLDNAVKFTSAGGIRLTARRDGEHLLFAVCDTGIGLDEGQRAGLFEAFAPGDGSDTRVSGGVGLGLAYANALIRSLNGSIEVTSQAGAGSTFTVRVPHRAPSVRPAPATRTRLGTVLVVDDDDVSRRIATAMVRRLGASAVVEAVNGAEAVAAYERGTFELVLMDCQMPVLDGFDATRRIREQEQHAGRPPVPVVAVTAGVLPSDRARCTEAGMDGFLAKPYTLDSLARLLEQVAASRADP